MGGKKLSIQDCHLVIDDNSDETTIKYSANELIMVLEKISLEIQAIENNYESSEV
jgi:hypothetical protein